jgi:hypothetical protein
VSINEIKQKARRRHTNFTSSRNNKITNNKKKNVERVTRPKQVHTHYTGHKQSHLAVTLGKKKKKKQVGARARTLSATNEASSAYVAGD